jgi:hypothetical protein
MITYTRDSRIKKIIQVCQQADDYLIGFGKYTPWGGDDLPLIPSGLERTVAELFHLQPVTFNPITSVEPDLEDDELTEVTINEKKYYLIEPTYEVLKAANCHLLLCQTEVVHAELNQTSWRSTGIFHSSTELDDLPSVSPDTYPTVYSDPPAGLQLIALLNHSAKTKETSAIETINLVLYCPDGF